VKELKTYGMDVDVIDPYASGEECMHEYGFGLTETIQDNYDAVIVAVSHQPYTTLDENYFKSICTDNGILIDVKGIYRHRIKELIYWSL
jgi:UDP-N-acetyl-D-galactosamine dehydrogenase